MGMSEEQASALVDAGERMYAPIEVAFILQLKTATVQIMCRDGRIEATKHGTMWRIAKSEVVRYLKDGPRDVKENKA